MSGHGGDRRGRGGPDMSALAQEAEQRWGHTQAWKQSARRAAGYTADDWTALRAEADACRAAFAEAMRVGAAPDSDAATSAAENHREHIARWFYDLDHEMHRTVSDLYTSDPRFADHYEQVSPGLAHYVRDAIHANADRHS